MNWLVASAGIESCLHKQNRVIEKFYANPKVFDSKFYAGLMVKNSAHLNKVSPA